MTASHLLWYLSRGSGLVLLMLMSAVVVLGVVTRLGGSPRRWPRFVISEVHRTLSLFTVALLALHVLTAMADPYVRIGWLAAVVPFTSPYRPFWTGLGALAVDIGAAVLLTSLVRDRLGYRTWRAVHWLAYLAWPIALAHSLRAGNDLRIGWVAALEGACTGAVAVAVGARLFTATRRGPAGAPRLPREGRARSSWRWPCHERRQLARATALPDERPVLSRRRRHRRACRTGALPAVAPSWS